MIKCKISISIKIQGNELLRLDKHVVKVVQDNLQPQTAAKQFGWAVKAIIKPSFTFAF